MRKGPLFFRRLRKSLDRRRREALVLYDDAALLVVDKPPGVDLYHGTEGAPSLLDRLGTVEWLEGTTFHPVHRLDKETSGALVLPKDRRTARHVSRLIASGGFEKRYLCVVEGIVQGGGGKIEAPLLPGNPGKVVTGPSRSPRLRPAVTIYRVLERFARHTLCEISIPTGRRHQIRLHMAHIGHPIVGDTLYGKGRSTILATGRRRYETDGLMLHASSVAFRYRPAPRPELGPVPKRGRHFVFRDGILKVEAPLPEHFQKALGVFCADAGRPPRRYLPTGRPGRSRDARWRRELASRLLGLEAGGNRNRNR